MKKYNYIVSVVMLLLSGYIFYESSGDTIGSSAQKNPAVWPCILAVSYTHLDVYKRQVQVYVDKLKAELADTMAMCGAHKLSDIKRSMIFGY